MQAELQEKIKELQDICKELNDDNIFSIVNGLTIKSIEKFEKKIDKLIELLRGNL